MNAVQPLTERPFTLLIAALGGEGGGLLTDWIVDACTEAGLLVQATSIPGVAQRTGATTYYLEIVAPPAGGGSPVLALYPSPGYIDMAVATDLVEAGRLIESGYVTPDRTTLVTSLHRVYAMVEKTAMGDGIFPAPRIVDAARRFARNTVLCDFESASRAEGCAINALLLGAMSGEPGFPVDGERLAAAMDRRGVAASANRRGLEVGRRLAAGGEPASAAPESMPPDSAAVDIRDFSEFPVAIHDVLAAAVARLADYQDVAYARRFLDRLRPLAKASSDAGEAAAPALREAARYLALWMTYEDVIRVADLKSRNLRHLRIRGQVGAGEHEPVRVTEFFKPGLDEFATVLPAFLARPLLAWGARSEARRRFNLPVHLRSDTVLGHLALRLVARRRRSRPRTPRFAEEQAMIDRWLEALLAALRIDAGLALEVARIGRMIKGYGDTRARANSNFAAIMSSRVQPAIAGDLDAAEAARLIEEACAAALADEDGVALAECLKEAPGACSDSTSAGESGARPANNDQNPTISEGGRQ